MAIIFRQAEMTDCEGIACVLMQSWQETYSNLLPKEYLETHNFEKCLHIAKSIYLQSALACQDDQVVGFVSFSQESREMVSIKPSGEVFGLYVLEAFQKKKIGFSLMMVACTILKNQDICLFFLKGNEKAYQFYLKLGFQKTNHKVSLPVLGGVLEEIEMVLRKEDNVFGRAYD